MATDYADVLLIEYDQLKREQQSRIRTRDALYVTIVTVMGALAATTDQAHNYRMLLLAPFAATVIGWMYLANDTKVSEIGRYVRQVLAPALSAQFDDRPTVFGWETVHRLDDPRWLPRKRLWLAADLLGFYIAPLAAAAVYWVLGGPFTLLAWIATVFGAGVNTLLAYQFCVHFGRC